MKTVCRPRAAFTLIELLVVIAIIALLAAILFPVFARARENARKTSCMNNMKQLGIGFAQYTQDYDECFPGSAQGSDPAGSGWVPAGTSVTTAIPAVVKNGAIFPYIRNVQVYICPSDTNASSKRLSFTMLQLASWKNLADAFQTSKTILLVDESATLNDGNFNPIYCGSSDVPTFNHLDGSNFLYVDGHMKFRRPDQLGKPDFRYASSDCP